MRFDGSNFSIFKTQFFWESRTKKAVFFFKTRAGKEFRQISQELKSVSNHISPVFIFCISELGFFPFQTQNLWFKFRLHGTVISRLKLAVHHQRLDICQTLLEGRQFAFDLGECGISLFGAVAGSMQENGLIAFQRLFIHAHSVQKPNERIIDD